MDGTQKRAKAYLEQYRKDSRSVRRQQKAIDDAHKGDDSPLDVAVAEDVMAMSEERQAQLGALRKDILTYLARLPGDEQDVLVARYIRGLPWRRVVDVMECSESTTYRLHRAGLRHLGEMLKE